MSPPDREQLKTQRRQGKGVITRHLRTINRLINEDKVEQVREQLDKLRSAFDNLEEIHSKYHELLVDDADLVASDEWFDEVDDSYNEGIKITRQWLRVQDELKLNVSTSSTSSGTNTTSPSGSIGTVTQGGTVGSASQVQTNVDIVTALNMPRVEIDVFSGNPLEYQSFMAVFNDSVDSQPIKDRMKLTRLLQYTSGAAKSAIRNCALIKDGTDAYTKAKDILKKRFGSDHLIVQKVIQDLKSGKPVLKAADMQQLADDLSMAASVLQDMNLMSEVGGQQSLLEIVERCPAYVVNKWKQKALKHIRTTDCYPVFQDFVDFVSDIALDWANPVYGRTGKSVKSHVQKVSQNFR